MATETAEFALQLEDEISASSESAEEALKSLQSQIDKDSKSLTQMKKAMRQMQAGTTVDVSAYKKLKGEIDATQNSISKARANFVNLGGDFSKIGRKTSGMKLAPKVDEPKGIKDMLSAVDSLPGPLSKASKGIGSVRSKIAGLTGAMGVTAAAILGVIAMITVLVAALAAVAAATAKATAELLKYAAAQADAARSERLRLEGLGTLRRWMRLTGKNAAQMSESIDRVAARVPLARNEVANFATQIHRLGIVGRDAEGAIEALSIAQAVQGDRGRQRIMSWIRMGVRGAALAARVRKELGGVAGAQIRSLSMISTKLRESFQALFRGINIEPLLSGLYRLSQLFSQNTQTGRALREIMEALLEPLIGEIGNALPSLERFFEEFVIMALQAAIAITDIQIEIRRAFGSGIIGRILRSQVAMDLFWTAIIAIGIVIGALVIGVFSLATVVIALLAPFMLLIYAFYRGWQATEKLRNSLPKLRELFQPVFWRSVGTNMISGIIGGLQSGAMRLHNSIRRIATNALDTFRSTLGIHSPSAVFARAGLEISRGVTEGVERGSPETTGAVGSMVSTTTSNVTSVRGGPSRSMTTGDIHIHIDGSGENAEDTARRVADALREFFDTSLATEPA